MRALAVVVMLVMTVAGGVWAQQASAQRAPTYLERVTIMDAFNQPGRSFASRCVRVIVSSADPRYAMVTSPIRYPKICLQNGETGDGYALFRRASRSSLVWRNIGEGSDFPCGLLPPTPLRDLFPTATC
jgi:hypothetical protein